MKWLLTKIGLPKAIGLYIDEDTVTLSRVVSTPMGPVEITRENESYTEETLREVVGRLVGPLLSKGRFRRTPVSVGIPSRKVYFSTRPVHATTGDSAPHVLLREALRSQNIAVNEMLVDVVKTQPDAREVASIAACDKNYLNAILGSLEALEVCPCRAEPAPCALLRLASSRHKARRGDKVVMRLLLSDSQILAILVVDKMPLLWRFTILTQGDEATSLVTAGRALLATSKDCGVESPLDAVMIHGRSELKKLLDVDWIEDQLDTSVNWLDEPTLDKAHIALGVAQGALDKSVEEFDLGRSLKPRPTLLQLFPWREAAMQCALVALMGLLLGYSFWTLKESRQLLASTETLTPPQARAEKQKLSKEKKEMESQVQALREFLDTRVLWTSCLRDLALCVPKDMYLTSIQGVCELPTRKKGKKGSSKTKKTFVLRGAIEIPEDRTTPKEIDELLVALRSDPTLEEEFPIVTLAELQQVEPRAGEVPRAIFSVVCLPGEKKTPEKKKEKQKKKK